MSLTNKIRVILDLSDTHQIQPLQMFTKRRYQWLDKVVQKYIGNYMYNVDRMQQILVSANINRVLEQYCNNIPLLHLYSVWIYASIIKALGMEGVYTNFIPDRTMDDTESLEEFMTNAGTLRKLLEFPETFVFTDDQGRSRVMNKDEGNLFIKNYMEYIGTLLHPHEINRLVNHSWNRASGNREKFRAIMAS